MQKSVFLWLLSTWLGQNLSKADFECRPLPDGKDDEDVPEGDCHSNEAQGDQRTNHLNIEQIIYKFKNRSRNSTIADTVLTRRKVAVIFNRIIPSSRNSYTRETREGWPLLTVEAKTSGDLWSIKRVLPWLVRWARRAGTRYFYPASAALISPVQNMFPHRTLSRAGSPES